MSAETLSQHQIDALLGRQAGQPFVRNRQVRPDIQIYDFRRPHRVSKERLRTLEAMYERLVKSLEGWLMSRVRGQIELRLLSVEQFSFGEFTLSLPTPCASYIYDIRDSGGQQGVIDFGHPFAYFLVDRLFGGAGTTVPMSRGLTPIERLAVRSVAERVMQLTQEIWQDHLSLDLSLTGFESIPEILRVANREEPVLVANIEVRAGGAQSLLINMLPFGVLEKFFSNSQRRVQVTGSEREQAANRAATESSLRTTGVAVAARLPEFRVSMRELMALTEGSIITTGLPTSAELEIRVNGQPRARAAAGRIGRALAARLLEPLQVPDDRPALTRQETQS